MQFKRRPIRESVEYIPLGTKVHHNVLPVYLEASSDCHELQRQAVEQDPRQVPSNLHCIAQGLGIMC